MHDDLQTVAGAKDVLAQIPPFIGLGDRLLQDLTDVEELAADVDEGFPAADGVGGDG